MKASDRLCAAAEAEVGKRLLAGVREAGLPQGRMALRSGTTRSATTRPQRAPHHTTSLESVDRFAPAVDCQTPPLTQRKQSD